MASIGIETNAKDVARILSADYLVGVDDTGAIPVPSMHGRPVLPAFSSVQALPPVLPPECARWERYVGHLLLTQLPYEAYVYLHPEGRLIPVAEVLAPMVALLEAAQRPSAGRLLEAFSEAVVYCAASHTPGFVTGTDTRIAVFSSLVALQHGLGETAWFATTGSDLLQLLPNGEQFVLNPGSPYEVTIPAEGLRPVRQGH